MSRKHKTLRKSETTGQTDVIEPESVGHMGHIPGQLTPQVTHFDGGTWKSLPSKIATSLDFPLDVHHEKSLDSDAWMVESRARARRLRRRRLIRVTSTLGLLNVRIASTNIKKFPIDQMQRAALLSELTYHNPETLMDDSRMRALQAHAEKGFPINVTGSEPTDCQVTLWLFQGNGDLYVAVRGDHDVENMYYSLGLSPKSVATSQLNVHEGFMRNIKNIEPCIRGLIDHAIGSVRRIIVTGHGLGGSFATIMAPLLAESFKSQAICCYTFGAARVGGRDFTAWFNERVPEHVRVIDSSDPIPFLPLHREDLKHPNEALCITRSGYAEIWGVGVQPSPQVLDGIDRISFEDWRWQQSAQKYRRRMAAAASRERAGRTFKEYVSSPRRAPRARGA